MLPARNLGGNCRTRAGSGFSVLAARDGACRGAVVGDVPGYHGNLEGDRTAGDGEDAAAGGCLVAGDLTELDGQRAARGSARFSDGRLDDPAALPGGGVAADLAEDDGQDAAVDGAGGDLAEVNVGDAAAHALITGAVGRDRVAGHLAAGDGHHAVVEDAAARAARSSVAVDHAAGDGRGAAVGDPARPGHRPAIGGIAADLAELDDQDAGAGAALAAGAAGDSAAASGRGVVIDLAGVQDQRAAVVEDAARAGVGGVVVHPAEVQHGRAGRPGAQRARRDAAAG